ncbi:MAG: serine hydrolase [Bacteroidota bacterium]|nr:serine hydrolase [Bacteroidota bacterium]
MRKAFIYIGIILFISTFTVFGQEISKTNSLLDSFIQEAKEDWKAPGLAVTIVKNGEVLFSKGYGIKELGKNESVNTKTMFAMASTTKAFTAMAIGMLVDEAVFDWDDPVVKYFPEFQLYDPYVSSELQIRDLLCHRAGLGNTDMLWLADYSEDEILRRMRYAKPAYSFRSGYTYQNVMYLAAGKLIEKATGIRWEDFIQQRILDPLEMTRTVPMLKYLEDKENYVSPHYNIDGSVEIIKSDYADNIGPAGSMWSCVDDMSIWIDFLLNEGKIGDKALLKPETFSELFSPQTIIPKSNFYPTSQLTNPNWTTYAMGWFQHDYKGRATYFHTGSLGGLVAIIAMVPENDFGIYVFSNLDHAELRHAIMYKAIDLYIDEDNSRDWNKEVLELYDGIRNRQKTRRTSMIDKRVQNTKPSLPLDQYAGIYRDDLYGDITISYKENKLTLSFTSSISGKLNHWHFDTFEVIRPEKHLKSDLMVFQLDYKGEVSGLAINGMTFKKL